MSQARRQARRDAREQQAVGVQAQGRRDSVQALERQAMQVAGHGRGSDVRAQEHVGGMHAQESANSAQAHGSTARRRRTRVCRGHGSQARRKARRDARAQEQQAVGVQVQGRGNSVQTQEQGARRAGSMRAQEQGARRADSMRAQVQGRVRGAGDARGMEASMGRGAHSGI